MKLPAPQRAPLLAASVLGVLLQLAVVGVIVAAPAGAGYLGGLILFAAFATAGIYAAWAMPLAFTAALFFGALLGTATAAVGLLTAQVLGLLDTLVSGDFAAAAVLGAFGAALGRRIARPPRAAA